MSSPSITPPASEDGVQLTEAILAIPYFSVFRENGGVVPDKPFIREILTCPDKLDPEAMSVDELHNYIETCIYFNLDRDTYSKRFVSELFWKITETKDFFERVFVVTETTETKWAAVDYIVHKQRYGRLAGFYVRGEFVIIPSKWSFSPQILEPLRSELVDTYKSNLNLNLNKKTLLKLGCRGLVPTLEEAASSGNIRLLKWTHQKHLHDKKSFPQYREMQEQLHSFEVKACSVAARAGHLDCLKYLYENKYLWDKNTCTAAIEGGNLACLEYIYKYDCPWTEDACSRAAKLGHLDCLKYLHRIGCKWDKNVTLYAVERGYFECLKYAHENGSKVLLSPPKND